MKEIDFIPEWYKSGRRRRMSYRTQYVVLGGVLAVMVVWDLIAAGSISRAQAELAHSTARQEQMQGPARQYSQIKRLVDELRSRAELLTQMDSRIDVAGVLGELSFLSDHKIVLSKVEMRIQRITRTIKVRKGPSISVRLRPRGAISKSRAGRARTREPFRSPSLR
jgi:hypothetical protein